MTHNFAPAKVFATGLTVTSITPPLPDVDGLESTSRTWVVVVHTILVHSDIRWRVQHDEGEVCQEGLVDLIEDCLTLIGVDRRLFGHEQLVQCRVAIEGGLMKGILIAVGSLLLLRAFMKRASRPRVASHF